MIPKLVMVLFRESRKLSLSLNSWFTVPFRFHSEFYNSTTQGLWWMHTCRATTQHDFFLTPIGLSTAISVKELQLVQSLLLTMRKHLLLLK